MKFFCCGLVEKSGFCLRFVASLPARPDQSVNICVVSGLGHKPLFYPLRKFWCPLAHKAACARFPWKKHPQELFLLVLPGKDGMVTSQTLHRIGKINVSEKKNQMSVVPQVSAAGCQQQSPGTPPSALTQRGHRQVEFCL